MKNIKRIIRAAVKTHGRAEVRRRLNNYRPAYKENKKAIQQAFIEFAGEK